MKYYKIQVGKSYWSYKNDSCIGNISRASTYTSLELAKMVANELKFRYADRKIYIIEFIENIIEI